MTTATLTAGNRTMETAGRGLENLVDRLINGDGTPEVVSVPGMRWRPGKLVSRGSLRGLPPLLET